jgi:hypothetical protein
MSTDLVGTDLATPVLALALLPLILVLGVRCVDPLRRAWPWPGDRASELGAEDAASTLFRFFRSEHVRDLRMIFRLAYFLLVVAIICTFYLGYASTYADGGSPKHPTHVFLGTYLGYLGATATVLGAVIAWAYQTASARLGVVDLFACEISTLCRVGTVFDTATKYVGWYDNPTGVSANEEGASSTRGFVSEEAYFPVFDSNSRDLQVLEARVVSHITEFYTYMKAHRDTRRALTQIALPGAAESKAGAGSENKTKPDPWQAGVSNVIYMWFLAYESGRKAIEELVEFQPTRAECVITTLITELKCYTFLIKYFGEHFQDDDPRYLRLILRNQGYKDEVKSVYNEALKHKARETKKGGKEWSPAIRLIPELEKRFKEALNADLGDHL